MSSIVLQGNLVNVPTLAKSKAGNSYARISVACSSRFKQGEEWKDTGTVFHNIMLYGSQAEYFCSCNLAKGTPLIIGGSYRVVDKPEFTDKDGVLHPAHPEMELSVYYIGVEIKTNKVTSEFVKSGSKATASSKPATPASKPEPAKATQDTDDIFGSDDDLFSGDDDIFA